MLRRSVEETDISDSSSDGSAENGLFRTTSSSSSSTPAHLFTQEDTPYLRQSYDGQPFYDLINTVDDMLGEEYTKAPLHRTSLLASTALLQNDQDVPPVTEGNHLLSLAERAFCSSQQSRLQVLYIAAKDFQACPTIDHWKKQALIWSGDYSRGFRQQCVAVQLYFSSGQAQILSSGPLCRSMEKKDLNRCSQDSRKFPFQRSH